MNPTLIGAFAGGVITLLSPCSVMLLPAFFSYAFTSPTKLLARTGVFYLGLITTLVPIGVLAGSVGAFVNDNRSMVVTVASWIVIALGVVMVAGITIPLPGSSNADGHDATSTTSVYALGTVYGIAGVCAGPLLGSVLTLATVGGSAAHGGLVLLVFAAGMVVPLIVLALVWDRLPWVRVLVRPRGFRIGPWSNTWTGLIGGALTIGVGVLLLVTEGTATLGGVLTVDDQFRLEEWVAGWSEGVPDGAFVAGAVAVLVGVWMLRRRRTAGRRAYA